MVIYDLSRSQEPSVAQRNEIQERGQELLRLAFLTKPLERDRVKSVVTELYSLAGHAPPAVLYCQSPMQLHAAASLLSLLVYADSGVSTWTQLERLSSNPWWQRMVPELAQQMTIKQVREHLSAQREHTESTRRLSPSRAISVFPQMHFHAELTSLLTRNFWGILDSQLELRWHRQVTADLRSSISESTLARRIDLLRLQATAQMATEYTSKVVDPIVQIFQAMPRYNISLGIPLETFCKEAPALMLQLRNQIWWGPWMHHWPHAYVAMSDVFGESIFGHEGSRSRRMLAFLKQFDALFFCVFLRGLCLVCERPQHLALDEQHRAHDERGAAVIFKGRFSFYSWRGVTVPPDAILRPAGLNVVQIQSEPNSSVRRALIEIYGSTKFLIDSGAQKIHEDDFGVLYRHQLPGDEALIMVKVVNSTPEPDGTYKDYFIRVPPHVETAREAVAWTFGIGTEVYDPVVQT